MPSLARKAKFRLPEQERDARTMKIGSMSIFIKNVKPDPSAADSINEILKIGDSSIFIKNVKPALL